MREIRKLHWMSKEIFSRCRQIRNSILYVYLIAMKLTVAGARLDEFSAWDSQDSFSNGIFSLNLIAATESRLQIRQ